jgi:uncharacterized phage protein (TIGR01671 family)
MREIKFRAWSKPRKEMREITDDWFIGDIKQKGFVIMQYTGLKDYNKKEVYESDIVTFTELDEDSCMGREDIHTGVIEWVADTAKWMFRYPSGQKRDLWTIANFEMISDFKVIGNIYENPELLK